MPGHGDQHRDNSATVNPFEENISRIKEFTAQEIATLQNRLDKQLGPEYISYRPGAGGGKVSYITADKVINLANEVFGFNGWSSEIRNVTIDFVDENEQTKKISLGLSTVVRVTLKDGTYHEDIGYGAIDNCKGKAPAFEKAKKEAATDAMKRALRNFGKVLGNCLYDKDYLSRITKVKVAASRWDAENLHRHPDFAPVKKEDVEMDKGQSLASLPDAQPAVSNYTDFDDEFGGDLLGEVEIVSGYSEETALPQSRPPTPKPLAISNGDSSLPQQNNPQSRTPMVPRYLPTGNGAQTDANASDCRSIPPQASNGNMNRPPAPTLNGTNDTTNPGVDQPQISNQRVPPRGNPPNQTPQQSVQHPPNHPGQQAPQQQRTHEPPVGFITSRAAELLTGQAQPTSHLADLPRFNPNAESPSIRKTSGVNHATSAPVSRAVQNGGTPAGNPMPAPINMGAPPKPLTNNFVNPSESFQRKIGAPSAGSASPLANRGAYKAPSMVQSGTKRQFVPSGVEGAVLHRPPLADMSNISGQARASISNEVGSEDAKRPRMTGP